MKRLLLLIIASGLYWGFENILKAQEQQKPQMFVVWENSVIPSQVDQYHNAVKKQVALMKKYHHTTPYLVYATEDYFYYWVTPINDFASFDALSTVWFSFVAEMEQKEGFIHNQEFKGTIYYIKPQILLDRPDLVFLPNGQSFDISKTPYFRFGYCYVKPRFEKEFEENWKDWVALFKKNNMEIGWNLNSGIFGMETPLYLWGEFYENPADMSTKRAKAYSSLGEEPNKLWKETEKLLRKIEYKTGWYRPDLSYIPEN